MEDSPTRAGGTTDAAPDAAFQEVAGGAAHEKLRIDKGNPFLYLRAPFLRGAMTYFACARFFPVQSPARYTEVIDGKPIMLWTPELAAYLEDAPWPATRDELIDYAIRAGAPLQVIENLQEIEDANEAFEGIEEIWPDYPDEDEFFFNDDGDEEY